MICKYDFEPLNFHFSHFNYSFACTQSLQHSIEVQYCTYPKLILEFNLAQRFLMFQTQVKMPFVLLSEDASHLNTEMPLLDHSEITVFS